LHFSSDVWSSSAVIVGLGFAALGFPMADPIAALVVAGVVLLVAWRLVKRSVDALLDRAPDGVADSIRGRVGQVPGVSGVDSVRVRSVGPDLHVEAVVRVDGSRSLSWAHDVADEVEASVRALHPRARVSVHVEPDALPPRPG
jgi:cation diffusion facilitator family transporter